MNSIKLKPMLILVCLGAVACAGNQMWYKPGATGADAESALARCKYEAVSATASRTPSRSNPFMSQSAQLGEALGEGFGLALKHNELMNLCMQAGGFRLVPAKGMQAAMAVPSLPSENETKPAPAKATDIAPIKGTQVSTLTGDGAYTKPAPPPQLPKNDYKATQMSKALGCDTPKLLGATGATETFQASCPGGQYRLIMCEFTNCKVMQ